MVEPQQSAPRPVSKPAILTNMTFWQSRAWRDATHSIYNLDRIQAGAGTSAPLSEALRLRVRRARFNVVLTEGARTSLLYGVLCLVSGVQSRQVMTEVFIDERPSHGILWRLKTALFRKIARRSFGILVNSSPEIDAVAMRFAVSREKIKFVPLCTTIEPADATQHDEGFILAAGRSHRDYPTLLQAAVGTSARFVIVCGETDLLEEKIPPNVEVRREVSRTDYLDLLSRCALVVLPLRPMLRATGQVVLLEAMSRGKPVVASRTAGIIDYVEDGVSGVLVEPGRADELAAAIENLVAHPDRARSMGAAGLAAVKSRFSFDGHARQKLNAIEEFLRSG